MTRGAAPEQGADDGADDVVRPAEVRPAEAAPPRARPLLSWRDTLVVGGFGLAMLAVIALISALLYEPADCGLKIDDRSRADFECRMHQARAAWCRRWASSMTLVHQCIEQSETTMREQVGG